MMRRRAETMVFVKMGKQLASQTWEKTFVTQRKSRKCNQNRSAENNAQLTKRAGNGRTRDQKKARENAPAPWNYGKRSNAHD